MHALFADSDNHIGLLAAANLGLGAVRHWAESFQPVLDALVPLGQVAVASVTVIYIIRKTALLKRGTHRRKK